MAMLDKEESIDDNIEFDETIPSNDIDLEEADEQAGDKIKKLQAKLKTCEAEKLTNLEELQRAKADFLNARKRMEEDRLKDKKRTSIHFIEELLPLCDSFHMAMSNSEVWNKVDDVWRKGVESIFTQLQGVLATHKVKIINPMGEEFNPNNHEAMGNVPVDKKEQHHKVVAVIQPGYIMEDNGTEIVIRPARVMVGEFTKN